jgi:hypothetical protein
LTTYITAQDTAVNRINSLLQFIQEENEHTETAKEQLFFLLSSLLLSIERIKIKRNGCAFKSADFELAYSFKKSLQQSR